MKTNKHRGYAPRSRAGLLISCTGFALLAATAVVPALASVVDATMGFGVVVAVVIVVSLPRLIPVGASWIRAEMPRTLATVVFVVSGAAAFLATTVGTTSGAVMATCLAVGILTTLLSVAVGSPPSPRCPSPGERPGP